MVGAGAIYHVVARGNDRQMLFLDDDDRARFMELLVDGANVVHLPVLPVPGTIRASEVNGRVHTRQLS